MGETDLEVLQAVTNESVFNDVTFKLARYDTSLSKALFRDPTIAADMAEVALNKVIDWLKDSGPLSSSHPWSFAKTMIYHSLVDSKRTSRERPLYQDEIKAIRPELSKIDESFSRLVSEEDRDEDDSDDEWNPGSGWRYFRLVDREVRKEYEDDLYHPHPWIKNLRKIFLYQWWWSASEWSRWVESQHKLNPGLPHSKGEVEQKLKEFEQKRWGQYHLIMALINDIPGRKERKLINEYLYGWKPVEIARQLEVSQSYVSQVLNRWLERWGWGEPDLYQARMIMLTRNVGYWYKETERKFIGLSPGNYAEARRLIDKMIKLEREKDGIEYNIDVYGENGNEDIGLDELWAKSKDLDSSILSLDKELDALRKLRVSCGSSLDLANRFYKRITTSRLTQHYFGDLEHHETPALLNVSEDFKRKWFGLDPMQPYFNFYRSMDREWHNSLGAQLAPEPERVSYLHRFRYPGDLS